MKIEHLLVSGGAGFIGSNFIRYALEARPSLRITNLDALTYCGNLENVADCQANSRYRFVKGDVCDRKLVRRLLSDVDAVLHLAAESHVDRSIMDSGPFVKTNVLGTGVMVDAALAAGGRRFVYVSTDEVYGSLGLEQVGVKFTEDSPVLPNSPYAASKAGGEMLVRAAHRTSGLDSVIVRSSNNFGPYQFPEKIIPLFVTNLIEGRKVPVYGDGRHVRDWIHVIDHAQAVLAVLERGRSGEVYNVGGDNERSNLELTRAILSIMGKEESAIEFVRDRPGHDRRYAVDSTRIRQELGWSPTWSSWPEALAQTVQWYVENPAWWQRVRNGAYREYYQRQYAHRMQER